MSFDNQGFRGSEAHLRKAAELINKGEWPDSVRESIHAVESVARQLDPAASNTLGPALASLEKAGQLHPALKKAFSSLSRIHKQSKRESAIHYLLTLRLR